MDAATRIIIAEISRSLNRRYVMAWRIAWFLILVAAITLVMLVLFGKVAA